MTDTRRREDEMLDALSAVLKERDELLLENMELRSENQALQFLKNDFEAAVRQYLRTGVD